MHQHGAGPVLLSDLVSRPVQAVYKLLQFFDGVLREAIRLGVVRARQDAFDVVPLAVVEELVGDELRTSVREYLLWNAEVGKHFVESFGHVVGCRIGAKAEGNGPARELVCPEQPLSSSVRSDVDVDVLERVTRWLVNDLVVLWV